MSALTHQDAPCRCSKGWVFVDDDYVSAQAAKAKLADGSIPAGTLDGLRNTTRPCHTCQPANYERWREGQMVGQGVRRTGGRRKARRSRNVTNREDTGDGR